MLSAGAIRVRHCGGCSRRELLTAGGVGALGLSLPSWLRAQSVAADRVAQADAVIFLWLWGGPSHVDLFDPKPKAAVEYRGPFSPIATATPGLHFTELLPRLAARSERLAVIRSLHTDSNDHGIAGTHGLTGASSGAISLGGQTMPGRLQPATGAIVAATSRSPAGRLPHNIALGAPLHQGHRRIAGENAAFLGPAFDPFRVEYDAADGVKLAKLQLAEEITPDRIANRRRLSAAFDDVARAAASSRAFESVDHYYQQAVDLLTAGAAREAFDLTAESEAVRNEYGWFRFGQSCLLARRLVERGVRFVQVNWSSHVEPIEDAGDGGWDMHDRNFPQLQDRHGWMLDQAASALLDDLHERGMLQRTLVVAMGEFGRHPQINAKAGREHWEHCYSGLLAGGGLPGGAVIGASDRTGAYPTTRPTTPADVAMTVYAALGLGAADLTELGLAPAGEAIEELV